MKKFLLMSTIIATFPGNTFAMLEGGSSSNSLQDLDYNKVSNLRKIQKKYTNLMKEQGCEGNLCLVDDRNTSPSHTFALVSSLKSYLTKSPQANSLATYQDECLAHLNSIRTSTILQPAWEAITAISLQGLAAWTCNYLDPDSFGSSLGIYSALSTCAFYAKDVIRAGSRAYYAPPVHPVDNIEKQYVKNQCFIPNQLWPLIIEKLTLARQNSYEQKNVTDFLAFTLELTTYKPRVPLSLKNKDVAKEQVLDNVNKFFTDNYEQPFEDLSHLRVNIKYFIHSLFDKNAKKPRPLFLYGQGGIGKTHFAMKLKEWVEQAFPHSVSYEAINITDPNNLEGDETTPGAFLMVLRNQCSQGTRGSIVMMDEATWLNKPEFEAPSKRTFNGDLTKLSTTYFGKGVEGRGIHLEAPLTLSIAASNQPIEDENLRSRFAHIKFPKPKKEALLLHAITLFNKQDQKGDYTKGQIKTIKKRIRENMKNYTNFREVESNLPIFLDTLLSNRLSAQIDNRPTAKVKSKHLRVPANPVVQSSKNDFRSNSNIGADAQTSQREQDEDKFANLPYYALALQHEEERNHDAANHCYDLSFNNQTKKNFNNYSSQ